MSNTRDWLPGKRSEQLAMANDWVRLFRSNGTRWAIPTSVQTELEILTETAEEALSFANSSDTRTPVTTAKCKAAFDNLICIRYENSKGQSGPWGPVVQAVIP